jgi:hypothetical protein
MITLDFYNILWQGVFMIGVFLKDFKTLDFYLSYIIKSIMDCYMPLDKTMSC